MLHGNIQRKLSDQGEGATGAGPKGGGKIRSGGERVKEFATAVLFKPLARDSI